MIKICKRCKLEKTLEEFYLNRNTKDGKSSYCKNCSKEYVVEYRQTIAGKLSVKKYLSSIKHKRALKKYASLHKSEYDPLSQKLRRQNNKERYNKYQRKYDKSEKGKTTQSSNNFKGY